MDINIAEQVSLEVKISGQTKAGDQETKQPIGCACPHFIFLAPIVLLSLLFAGILLSYCSISIFKLVFFLAAGFHIYIYGRYAFEIHNIKLSPNDRNNHWYIYNQYWFNGLGAFMGWLALYILIFYRISPGEINHFFSNLHHWANHLQPSDLILVLVAFLGLTGYFPYVVLLGKFS